MSELKVTAERVLDIKDAYNSDALEVMTIRGWQVITRKGSFKVGDIGIYFPIDSILTQELEDSIFGIDSKVKLSKHRVKAIKLRGNVSCGLFVPSSVVGIDKPVEGNDYTVQLKVTKFEPAEPSFQSTKNGGQSSKKQINPNFSKYTDVENLRNYPDVFTSEDIVNITEKIHGTSARYQWSPFVANKWWKKILKFIGYGNTYEFNYGSRNVQLQEKINGRTFYDTNVYAKMIKQYDIKNKLPKGYGLYGEIVGDGIQKNYTYGCKQGEHKFYAYDIKYNGQYVNYDEFVRLCDEWGIDRVPELYIGNFDLNKVIELTKGDSVLCPTQKVREGVVVKTVKEKVSRIGRTILKYVSDEYLMKDNTDFH